MDIKVNNDANCRVSVAGRKGRGVVNGPIKYMISPNWWLRG